MYASIGQLSSSNVVLLLENKNVQDFQSSTKMCKISNQALE